MGALHLIGLLAQCRHDMPAFEPPQPGVPLVLAHPIPPEDQEQIIAAYREMLGPSLVRIDIDWNKSGIAPQQRALLHEQSRRTHLSDILLVLKARVASPSVEAVERDLDVSRFEHKVVATPFPVASPPLTNLVAFTKHVCDAVRRLYFDLFERDDRDQRHLSESWQEIEPVLHGLMNPVDVVEAANSLIERQFSGIPDQKSVVAEMSARLLAARTPDERIVLIAHALGSTEDASAELGPESWDAVIELLEKEVLLRNGELTGWAAWLMRDDVASVLAETLQLQARPVRPDHAAHRLLDSMDKTAIRRVEPQDEARRRIEIAYRLLTEGQVSLARQELSGLEVELLLGEGSILTQANYHHAIGMLLWKDGQCSEAEEEYRQALRLREQGGDSQINRAMTLHEWAQALLENGKHAEAGELFLEATRLKAGGGDTSVSRATTMLAHARCLRDYGDTGEARRLFSEAFEVAGGNGQICLPNEDLRGSDLSGRDLSGVVLDGSDLTGATFEAATLTQASMRKAILRGANLARASLAQVDLSGAILSGANLSGTCLAKTVLKGANLDHVDLRGASLELALVDDASFDGATMDDRLLGFCEPQIIATNVSGTLLYGGHHSNGWVMDIEREQLLDTYGKDALGLSCDRAVSEDGTYLLQISHRQMRIGIVDPVACSIRWRTVALNGIDCPGVAWHPDGWFLIVELGTCWRYKPQVGVLEEVTDAFGLSRDDRADLRSMERVLEDMVERDRREDWYREFRRLVKGDGHSLVVRAPYWIVGGRNITVWHEKDRRVVWHNAAESTELGERADMSPDGRWLSVLNRAGLSLYSTLDWRRVGDLNLNGERCQHAWAPDSQRIAALSNAEWLVLAAVSPEGRLSELRRVHTGWAHGVAFIKGNRVVVSTNVGLLVFDAETAQLSKRFPHVPSCRGADFSGATGLSARARELLGRAGAIV